MLRGQQSPSVHQGQQHMQQQQQQPSGGARTPNSRYNTPSKGDNGKSGDRGHRPCYAMMSQLIGLSLVYSFDINYMYFLNFDIFLSLV
jgi:hypothetical protein